MTEGYVTELALDEEREIIGFAYIKTGQMLEEIQEGVPAQEALEHARGISGRYEEGVFYIDPRRE